MDFPATGSKVKVGVTNAYHGSVDALVIDYHVNHVTHANHGRTRPTAFVGADDSHGFLSPKAARIQKFDGT